MTLSSFKLSCVLVVVLEVHAVAPVALTADADLRYLCSFEESFGGCFAIGLVVVNVCRRCGFLVFTLLDVGPCDELFGHRGPVAPTGAFQYDLVSECRCNSLSDEKKTTSIAV